MITTFGEIMLRISPASKGERIGQALNFRIEPGGSEANVAIAVANLGLNANFVTKIPNNELSNKVISHLRQFSVDTRDIKLGGDRLGIYWTEIGIGPRSSFVLYDRDMSSFSEIELIDIDWEAVLKKSDWFHTSGISPGISQQVYSVIEKVLQINNDKFHIPVSIDLNYRKKLWRWVNKDKNEIVLKMCDLCTYATLLTGNETDFKNCLNFSSNKNNDDEYYADIARLCFQNFCSLKYIAISIRKMVSISINKWTGYLFIKDDEQFIYKGIQFNIDNILDRVGAGDSFTAGIIYGFQNNDKFNFQEIINFAVTLSALKHTIFGDASRFCINDVILTMNERGRGKIIR